MRVATFRHRFATLSLAKKLAWLSAGLSALFVTATLIPLSLSTRQTTRQIVAKQLNQTQRALLANQSQELSRLEYAATLIGRNAEMKALMADDRSAGRAGLNPVLAGTVRRALEGELGSVGQDLIVITDDSGRVFTSAARQRTALTEGTDLSSLPAIRVALDPDVPADTGVYGVLNLNGGSYSVAAVPLVAADRTLGAILLGQRIDSGYLASVQSAFEGDVVVTGANEIIATTRKGLDPSALAVLAAASSGGAAQPTVRIHGEELVAAPLSLGADRNGALVTLWLLQPMSQLSARVTRPLVFQFVVYGLLAILLSGIGAAIVARSVLDPLNRFISHMRGVTPATEPRGFEIGAVSPEIRTLNESFSTLMTSLRESEAQLRQSQKLEAIGTLAGGIAHDFNNLLTVITGYTQLAMMRMSADDELKEDLKQVVEASDRAARLTHQLLAFSRKQVLQPTLIDLNAIVEGVIPMLRRLIGENIAIELDGAPSLAFVIADRSQLEQVIINLVVNARDAMPKGGSITIRTSNRVAAGEHRVVLAVSDTGVGIPPEVRDRIFEPFFTTKEQGKGTGLGLSMVYGIIKQSGGTIDVESRPGQGTTFTIDLPRASEDAASSLLDEGMQRSLPGGRETILIIEDELEVRELARRTLDGLGYTVIASEEASEALAAALTKPIDLLLTDVVMPGLSGPQIVDRLGVSGVRPMVVYMSGYTDDELDRFALGGDVMLLRKPFSPAELARMVRSALDGALTR